jgi:hypothetical protein
LKTRRVEAAARSIVPLRVSVVRMNINAGNGGIAIGSENLTFDYQRLSRFIREHDGY